ncbi:TonB-dependent receptor [Pseudoalteromonas sp. CST5]|uniref:TonB-dependent receptor n=1 Tax=unclassified Pseudoalteromonas TaxID=194690 RepID=UPI0023591BF8|nr:MULTISPECIES: TonB-dependent receptor [unclassified Pseudoalteromonas]MDC9512150.1 TonB-dependent receptor [Pseudoalteromonas sp. CST1]MDC9536386.1 TonB-dependent receptor [Pseudoalteromonas sp. CST3]MDC9541080.1 TonB-dependent receptor [Pseudoalteromonas sp. CST2]MDC9545676.1 TonB-dependent receptor [Pseudoalteromonas sp. CST4]MDC9548983.1 TonB-dependent receptor [Pseudoalteromonas sp. CST5]
MKTKLQKTALSLAIAACVSVSGAAFANETTSAIKGQITGPNGNPAPGTKITILHVPSGSVKTTEANDAGYFTAKGLRVGGPYKVIVDSDVYADQEFNNIILNIGNDYPVNAALEPQSSMEQIVVTGAPISSMSGGTGPASTFTLTDLENTPAINRDLKDIIRIDPRITIDDSRGSINCGGGNPRYNSLTLDGVRMNDNFGLSSNGYPTIRAPFSFDSIEQVSAELAPFDVQYGGFTSCNINAVTKSGGNEVHGGIFYDFTSDSFKGDEIEGEDVDNGNYTEKRYGFNVGLPLIEDKLFLFTSYEKLEGVQQFNYDGLSSGSVTADDIARITSVAQSVYGYDVGGMPSSMPVEDEKILVKLDWNINEDHRANLIYNYNDGNTVSQSDTGSSRVSLSNHFYDQSAEFTSIIGSVYSDWSDDFSTEVRIGKSELDATVQSLDAASSFGEMQIRTEDGGTVYIGPDDSRQSNDLDYDTTTFKVAGTYYLDQHTITAGYEFEELDVFNLFVQHTEGEYRFDSIDDFEDGLADRVYYNNAAATNDPNDAAASFSYAQHTFYVQDEYAFTDLDANITFGLRYDKYTSDDVPNFNQNFTDRYGFSNQSTFDGIDLLQPRVGFQWYATDELEVRAGVGLFSGGNPNVWLSNSYSNDGITNIGTFRSPVDLFNTPNVNGGAPGFEVPQEMFDEVANTVIGSGDSATNAVDPDFEIPSEWKYSIGATYTTENEYVISLDYLYSKKKDAALMRDIALQDSGETTFDGRPLYESIEGRSGEYLLTNVSGDSGDSSVISLAVSKMFDNGVSVNFGYAYTDSDDVNPMTSSVAGSNYGNIALTDPGNPGVASSDYEIPHRFTMTLGYSHEFVDGFATRFNLYGEAYKGLPYSYTFDGSDRNFGDSNWNGSRQLLYVPLENDPNVVYDMSADEINAFNDFIASNGLERGEITGRNAENSDWFVKFNFKVTQELPGFMDGHKGEAFFVIDNLTNLLNDDWGVLKKGPFVGASMIKTTIDEQGRYVYSGFNENNANTSVQSDASLWQMRVGVRYTF